MPSFCLILDCSYDKKGRPDLSFCRVPKVITNQGEETEILSTKRRTKWLVAISRDDLTENILENDRVCGIHFLSGKAAYLRDRFNPDWVPSLHLGHNKVKNSDTTEKQQQRAQGITVRRKREREHEEQAVMKTKLLKIAEPGERVKDIFIGTEGGGTAEGPEKEDDNSISMPDVATQTDSSAFTRSCGTQTEECDYLFLTPKSWLPEKSTVFQQDNFEGVRFYTGLHSMEVLMKTFSFVSPHVNRRSLSLVSFRSLFWS